MISKSRLIISIFIAANAAVTAAQAENVYKCGSTYSQSPCSGGKLISVDDSRDPRQKLQKDAATQRDAELAKEMEKTRLANEKAWRATETKRTPGVKAHPPKPAASKEAMMVIKPKRLKQKYDKPNTFTALVPGSGHKSTKKHSVKNTDLDKQP
ncbi:MAG TPA: hypothetical protein VIM63_13480 [Rhodoferax sp.]